jgi:hypothetical protein
MKFKNNKSIFSKEKYEREMGSELKKTASKNDF